MSTRKTNLSLPEATRVKLDFLAAWGHRTITREVIRLIEREYANQLKDRQRDAAAPNVN
jgi:hypothetical protein